MFFKLFREEQKNYNSYVPIPTNRELIHVPVPLKRNQFQKSFLKNFAKR